MLDRLRSAAIPVSGMATTGPLKSISFCERSFLCAVRFVSGPVFHPMSILLILNVLIISDL